MKSDAQIQHDVMDEIHWDQALNASKIDVAVNQGVVTLAGHVTSYTQKWHAEQAAQRVAGVQALVGEIGVMLPAASQRADADITRAIQNVISWSSYLPDGHVDVAVESGWVTLSGQVDWDYQKLALANAVSPLMGVTGISNKISVRPAVTVNDVKADIEAALRRRSNSEVHHVIVDVDNSDVTLSGIVDNWVARDLAHHTALRTPGVKSVTNNITIAR